MATILTFTNLNRSKTSDTSSLGHANRAYREKTGEIIIFPGIRIERISSDKIEQKQNLDMLSKRNRV